MSKESRPSIGQNLGEVGFEKKNFFSKMSEKGRSLMSKAYEGVYDTPVVNRVVGKMQIAYNQFWIDKKEEKSVKMKGKMDSLDLRSETMNKSKEDMLDLVKDFKEREIPGVESLLLKVKEIDDRLAKMAKKKNALQSRIEIKENKINLYTNKRDGIADRLISHYDKKLTPIEGKLNVLNEKRNSLGLEVLSSQIKQEELRVRLNDIKNRKLEIEDSLRKSGESERKIKNFEAIKILNDLIESGEKRIEEENLRLSNKRDSIDKKVARADKKAQPYRNRKDEFIRVKNKRPVDIGLKQRATEKEFKGEEKTNSHSRVENNDNEQHNDTRSSGSFESSRGTEADPKIGDFISTYNEHVKKSKAFNYLNIDEKDLLRAANLSVNTRLSSDNFKALIKQFYKVNKIPEKDYMEIVNSFNQK